MLKQNLARNFILITALATAGAHAKAQSQVEPTELIRQTPTSSYSNRDDLTLPTEISQDELNTSVRPLWDSINTLPGMQARDSGVGLATISIRGSSQADRVLNMFDGWAVNLSDNLGAQNLFIPQELIGSMSVSRGAASALYGPQAMAGVINFRSRLFDHTAVRASLSDDSGQFGSINAFGAIPIGKSSQVSLLAENKPGAFTYNDPLGAGRQQNNDQQTYRATFSGESRWGEVKIRPTILLANQRGNTPGPLYAPSAASYNTYGTLVGVDASFDASPNDTLDFRVSNLLFWRNDAGGESYTSASKSAATVDWKKTWNRWLTMNTFADTHYDTLSGTYVDSSQLAEFQAEVGQSYQIKLVDQLRLEPVYRYMPQFGSLTKAISLRQSSEKFESWLTYSEGFRAASLSDRLLNSNSFKGNSALVPETSQGFEIGTRFEQGRRYGGYLDGFTLGATAYSNQIQNVYDTLAVASGAIEKINNGSAHTRGFEVNAGYGISVWTLTASHAYLDAKNESTGESLRLAPKNQTSLALSNQLGPALIELKETIWSSYIDKDLSNAAHKLGGWNTLDLNVRTMGLANYEIRAGILNVLDTAREFTYGYPEQQRRFYLSALESF